MLEGRLSYQEGFPRGEDPNAKPAKLAHLSTFFILSDIFCSTAIPDPTRTQLNVVVNWFEELKRLAPLGN